MPKSVKQHLYDLVQKYSGLQTDGKTLTCGLCEVGIKWDQKHGASTVLNHVKGKKHQQHLDNNKKSAQLIAPSLKRASLLAQNNQDLNQFITQKLVEADIPLAKLDHSSFRELLETLSGKALPRANTLRSHLTPTYDMVIEKVRKFIGDNDIYLQ